MKIDEAIERLEKHAIIAENHYNYSLHDAFKLGIEALKRELQHRQDVETNSPWLLPEETEE